MMHPTSTPSHATRSPRLPLGGLLATLALAMLSLAGCGTEAEPSARPPAGVTDTSTDEETNLPGPDDATEPDDGDEDAAQPDTTAPDDTTPDPPDTALPPDVPDEDADEDATDDVQPDTDPSGEECDDGQTREQTCADGSVGSTCRCDEGRWTCSGNGCRNERCDDGSALACRALQPTCTTGNIPAVIDGCWRCVNATTCTAIGGGGLPIDGACTSDTQCAPDAQCSAPSTPGPPLRRCQPHGCASESAPTCDTARPACSAGEVSVVRGGCWICVDDDTCTSPDDPGVLACRADVECAPDAYCDACASSSCPDCDDCIPDCLEHACTTETVLTCRCARPECGDGGVAVIRDGCWVCVDLGTCRADTDADACGS